MTVAKSSLTELEGAVLSEINDRGCRTAFQVRRAFQVSHSLEWSGSAGAVYPAIRRLTAAGLLCSEAMTGGRKAMSLKLSAEGLSALQAWACDPDRAITIGLDPFRLRSGIWRTLAPGDRGRVLRAVAENIKRNIAAMEQDVAGLDPVERPRVELAVDLQRLRLRWVETELAGRDQASVE